MYFSVLPHSGRNHMSLHCFVPVIMIILWWLLWSYFAVIVIIWCLYLWSSYACYYDHLMPISMIILCLLLWSSSFGQKSCEIYMYLFALHRSGRKHMNLSCLFLCCIILAEIMNLHVSVLFIILAEIIWIYMYLFCSSLFWQKS